MKKNKVTLKQILAWAAIILLAAMYVITFICSLINSPFATQMFQASLFCTFFIPVMVWVFILTIKLVKKDTEENSEE